MYVSRMDRRRMGMMVRGCYVDAVCYLAEGFLRLIHWPGLMMVRDGVGAIDAFTATHCTQKNTRLGKNLYPPNTPYKFQYGTTATNYKGDPLLMWSSKSSSRKKSLSLTKLLSIFNRYTYIARHSLLMRFEINSVWLSMNTRLTPFD